MAVTSASADEAQQQAINSRLKAENRMAEGEEGRGDGCSCCYWSLLLQVLLEDSRAADETGWKEMQEVILLKRMDERRG